MRRFASAAAATAVTAALLPIPAALSPVSADPESEEPDDPLVVEHISPDVIDEDSTVRVTGTVTNTTAEDLEDVTVQMRYSRHPFSDREELDEFASGDGWQPDAPGPDEELADTLAPDAEEEYSLSVPTDELGLSDYGVYPLVIEAVDSTDEVVGAQYTFLPYTDADDDVPTVDLAWVWPLMDEPQRADDDTFLHEEFVGAAGEQGRLGRLLAAGAQTPVSFEPEAGENLLEELGLDEEEPEEPAPQEEEEEATPEDADTDADESVDGTPGEEDTEENDGETQEETEEEAPTRTEGVPVTWAVDPGTLDDVVRMATDEYEVVDDPLALPDDADQVRHEYEADETAQVWLREARRVLAADTVAATPYASPDLAALLRNELESDAEASLDLGREKVGEALDLEADERFALPADGLMDQSVYELLAEDGAERFLLDEDAMPAASWLSSTPPGQAPLPALDNGPEEEPYALVQDEGISDVLSMPSWEPGESELALQRFAAETAMIAGENASSDRVVVASPQPEWDPSPELAGGVLSASEDLPWLEVEDLDQVELPDADEREETRNTLTYPDDTYDEELSSAYLGQVEDVNREVGLFNSILVEDNDPFRPALLRLQSTHLRDQEALTGVTRSLVEDSVQERLGDVRIIPGEPVTLASRTGITGVLVANDLEDEAVYVHLSVYSANSERLRIDGDYTDSFQIAPGAKTTVYVPLAARINGRTVLHVSLHNAEGEPLSAQDTQIPVNATGLGTQALLISGIGVLILVAALAPRALRSWARRKAREPQGEAGSPEAADALGVTGAEPAEDAEATITAESSDDAAASTDSSADTATSAATSAATAENGREPRDAPAEEEHRPDEHRPDEDRPDRSSPESPEPREEQHGGNERPDGDTR